MRRAADLHHVRYLGLLSDEARGELGSVVEHLIFSLWLPIAQVAWGWV